jgi:vacuolar-type H+-ATPase subunit H
MKLNVTKHDRTKPYQNRSRSEFMPMLLELYEELKDKLGDKTSRDLIEAIQEIPNERLKRIEDGIDKLRLWTEQGFKELKQSTDKEFKEIRQDIKSLEQRIVALEKKLIWAIVIIVMSVVLTNPQAMTIIGRILGIVK